MTSIPFHSRRGVNYEIWAPGGLFEPAEQLLADWPKQLLEEDVRAAFDAVTTEYERLKDFTWDSQTNGCWKRFARNSSRGVSSISIWPGSSQQSRLHVRYFAVNSVMLQRLCNPISAERSER